MIEMVKISCANCGKDVEKPLSMINRSIRRGYSRFYCTKKCQCRRGSVEVKCVECGNIFLKRKSQINKTKSGNHFCSQSCAAKYNNRKYPKRKKRPIMVNGQVVERTLYVGICGNCEREFTSKYAQQEFCSKACELDSKYREYIKKWLNNEVDGSKGKYGMSGYIKRYLIETRKWACEECGWAKTNIFSKRIPLHIHHKDGNYKNNKIDNLQILCPNCHSLTSTFCSLNMGHGRYNKNKNF